MLRDIGEGAWLLESQEPGPSLCLAFGTHGNERAPLDAGLGLVERFRSRELELASGSLLLLCANPRAVAEDSRWSSGGLDLNRCFHRDTLAREATCYEEERAREITGWLSEHGTEVLVDFHCTVEPGERFVMHHPAVHDAAHREVVGGLEAEIVLADPELQFGAVSLDEWMSTRGRVGICYETGWLGDPTNGPEDVEREMCNVLALHGLVTRAGKPLEGTRFEDKRRIQLYGLVECDRAGFAWRDGVGHNLQELPADAVLGQYGDGTPVELEREATLVFPKKKPELVQLGKPLVLLAERLP